MNLDFQKEEQTILLKYKNLDYKIQYEHICIDLFSQLYRNDLSSVFFSFLFLTAFHNLHDIKFSMTCPKARHCVSTNNQIFLFILLVDCRRRRRNTIVAGVSPLIIIVSS